METQLDDLPIGYDSLLRGRGRYGNKWKRIAEEMPGRRRKDIQNHWCNAARSAARPRQGDSLSVFQKAAKEVKKKEKE